MEGGSSADILRREDIGVREVVERSSEDGEYII